LGRLDWAFPAVASAGRVGYNLGFARMSWRRPLRCESAKLFANLGVTVVRNLSLAGWGWQSLVACMVMALGAGVAAANESLTESADQLAASVLIHRDAWGVPHIDGPTDASVIFGFAYCQAEDYFWQLEDSYVMGLGRYAELYGDKGLKNDMINRAFEIPQRSQADYEKMEPKIKESCEAFVKGVNYYLEKHPEVKPRLIERFEPWQMIAMGRQVILEMTFGNTGQSKDHVPTDFKAVADAGKGSNAWALSPSRTKNGKAMLFINPHQPYYGFGQFYEGHMKSGEGWNFTGATFFGSPIPTLGHNEHLGWAFTVNNPGIGSAWRETFDDPANPLNYRYDKGYRQATEWKDTIRVKKKKGMEEREFVFRKTHHGPIIRKESDTSYIVANIGKFYDALLSRQNLAMVRAKNFAEWRTAMGMLEFHIFNTVYADREGNIFYLYNGIVPRRDPSFDWSSPVDGSNPATEWNGIHTIDELPQTLNPPSGFVQNCNQTPYTVTDDGNPSLGDYPDYMVRERHDDKRRAKVSRMLLREMKDMEFDGWQKACFDTTLYWAVVELPALARLHKELETSNPDLAAQSKPYFDHLMNWDRKVQVDSTQATLCIAWYEQLYGDVYRSETLQRQFIDDPSKKFNALLTAAQGLKKVFGDWKVPYGDVYRLQRHANVADFFQIPFNDKEPSLPSAGSFGPLGIVFNMYFTPSIDIPLVKTIKKRYAVVGASYVSAVEFSDRVQAVSLLQYGESGHADSPHFFDQAKLMSQMQFKPQPFYWDDVLKAAKRSYHPGQQDEKKFAGELGGE
jgi:penicillin amidase